MKHHRNSNQKQGGHPSPDRGRRQVDPSVRRPHVKWAGLWTAAQAGNPVVAIIAARSRQRSCTTIVAMGRSSANHRAAIYKIASRVHQPNWRKGILGDKPQNCFDVGNRGHFRPSSHVDPFILSPIDDFDTVIPQARSAIRVPILWSAGDLSSNRAEKFFRRGILRSFERQDAHFLRRPRAFSP
jgi:hypothetical protein